MGQQRVDRRSASVPIGRVDDNPGGLVDGQEMVVFEQDVDRTVFCRGRTAKRRGWQVNGQSIACAGPGRRTSNRDAVHRNTSFFNPPLNARSGREAHIMEMAAEHQIQSSPGITPVEGHHA